MAGKVTKLLGAVGAALVLAASGVGAAGLMTNGAPTTKDVEVVAGAPQPSASENPTASVKSVASLGFVSDESELQATSKPSLTGRNYRWAIRKGAPIEDFPVTVDFDPSLACIQGNFPKSEDFWACMNNTPSCTQSQLDWLGKYGIPLNDAITAYEGTIYMGAVKLRNTSSSSQSISIKDVKLQVDLEPASDAGFNVACQKYTDFSGGATAGPMTSRAVRLPSGGGVGTFGQSPEYGEDLTRNVPAGAPAVVNLAAGESTNLTLETSVSIPSGLISGQVIATVSTANGDQEVLLNVEGFDGQKRMLSDFRTKTLVVHSGAMCPKDITPNGKYRGYGTDPSKPCTVKAFQELSANG